MKSVFRRFPVRFLLALFLALAGSHGASASSWGASLAGGAETPKQTVEFKFLGQPYRWIEPPRSTATPASWGELATVSEQEGKSISAALDNIAKRYPLDAYGRLMLLRELALRVPLTIDARRTTFHNALGRGWDDASRAFFVAAQLNLDGYRAVVVSLEGRALVGLPVVDPELNARTESITAERSFLGQTKTVERRYLLWDVQGRLGDPAVGPGQSEMLTPLEQVLERDEGKFFDFRTRKVPAQLAVRRQSSVFNWPGGKAVGFTLYPDIARYLELYPEHTFNTQLLLEREEVKRLGLNTLASAFGGVSEEVFVSQLLQAVQANFVYTPGPLRSVEEIFLSRKGDCDQLALVLALLLLESGYPESALAAVSWQDADHLGLALRPRQAGLFIAGGAQFQFDNAPFFVLDPTFYHKRDEELITAWGEMNPENLHRKASVYRLAVGQ
jgi:hypothetical protein